MLVLFGLNHRSAPVSFRERVAFKEPDLPAFLSRLRGEEGVEEALILSTCNRVEILVRGGSDRTAGEALAAFLGRERQVTPEELERYTFRYEREYPHPPERVWQAITAAEHMDAWFMPRNVIEPRQGGRFAFGFGGDPGPAQSGIISLFEPPRVVEFLYDNGNRMRYELHPIEGGTRLYLVDAFDPAFEHEPGLSEETGGDLPGGLDTPWRPGFMAGFLIALTNLDRYLAGNGPTLQDAEEMVRRVRAGESDEHWLALTGEYRQLIRESIPRLI